MSAPDIILKLSNIESYYGPIMAIRGISLEVPRGQIVTLLDYPAAKLRARFRIVAVRPPAQGRLARRLPQTDEQEWFARITVYVCRRNRERLSVYPPRAAKGSGVVARPPFVIACSLVPKPVAIGYRATI